MFKMCLDLENIFDKLLFIILCAIGFEIFEMFLKFFKMRKFI